MKGPKALTVILLLQAYSLTSADDEEVHAHIERIKKDILASLGMQRVPNVSRHHVDASTVMSQALVRSMQYSQEQDDLDDDDGVRSAVKYFYTFVANESKKENEEGWEIKFDLKNVTSARLKRSLVTNAHLKLYRTFHSSKRTKFACKTPIMVQLYQKLASRAQKDSKEAEEMLIQSQYIDEEEDWYRFDVLQTMRMWWQDDLLNNGLRIRCLNCQSCGISFDFSDRKPQIDMYAAGVLLKRIKRSWKRRNMRRFGKKRKRSKSDCTTDYSSNKCCRYNMWVSFEAIGWDSWILSPKGFDAYYCKGRCPGRFKPANTHTLVQTAMRQKVNSTLPKPCCVPKKLTPLSLYHYDDSDPPELVLTTHKGMIVKTCACS